MKHDRIIPLPISEQSGKSGLRRRIPFYVALLIVGVLIAAYIDGGEEPLHPIIQEVSVPQTGVDAT
ncbi:hypothetical protein [Erythrobacter sp. YT30]|uniref:hypothetical protein n=1 Tax=Erythrobacter sp. YT30 TaxID=1735012 RepID=UPI00076BCF86|nr:hypothetical protein [Erythrobacter sp. YT30]KWV92774.1 hypothetical protein AUC45_00995 [Erythrobacter sp. YT30]